MSRVAVIGGGYVGLPTAGVLAHFGHDVVCAERDERRYCALADGRVPIVEDGLGDLVHHGQEAGRLRFVRRAKDAARGAQFVFLCVDTPERGDGAAVKAGTDDRSTTSSMASWRCSTPRWSDP